VGRAHNLIELVDDLGGVDILDYLQPDLSHFEDRLFFLTVKALYEFFEFRGVFVFVEQFDQAPEDEGNARRVPAFVVDHVELLHDRLVSCFYELVFPLRDLHLRFVVQQSHYH
jgi:hypothetical protein